MARAPSWSPKTQGSGLPSFRESRPTMSFRDNLQHLRATHAMTQEQLALMLGVSRQSVTKWEAEKSYPEMDKLLKLCQIFDVTLDDLVQGDLTTSVPTAAVQARACRSARGRPVGRPKMCAATMSTCAPSHGRSPGACSLFSSVWRFSWPWPVGPRRQRPLLRREPHPPVRGHRRRSRPYRNSCFSTYGVSA